MSGKGARRGRVDDRQQAVGWPAADRDDDLFTGVGCWAMAVNLALICAMLT
jgi:hypothetical protein